jgi:hypothetical protein
LRQTASAGDGDGDGDGTKQPNKKRNIDALPQAAAT